MKEVNAGALIRLKNARHLLTDHQYKNLRGQVLAGDPEGAMRGLRNVLQRRRETIKNNVSHETMKREERNQ